MQQQQQQQQQQGQWQQQQPQGQQGQQNDNSHFYSMWTSQIIGRLTRDPEIKPGQKGNFASITLAVNQKNGETQYVDISISESRSTLFNMIKTLVKGRRLLAIGDVTLKSKDKGGVFVDMYAHDLRYMDSGQGNGQGGGQQQQQQQQPAQQMPPQGQPQGQWQQQQPQGQPQGQWQQQPQGAPQGQWQQPQGMPQHQPQGGYVPPQQPQYAPNGAPVAR